jgi:hypothetical protein
MRTEIFTSHPTRCKPKRMINAPAIGAIRVLFRSMNEPTALAEAPSVIKTTEKPITNAKARASSLPVEEPSPSFNCSTPTPESIET